MELELWTCARCGHIFFGEVSECPKCLFASYRLLDIVSPYQVAFGSFRFIRKGKSDKKSPVYIVSEDDR